jgi:hypothetical protein
MFDGLRERSVIRAILYSVHDNGNLAMAFKGLRRYFRLLTYKDRSKPNKDCGQFAWFHTSQQILHRINK